MCFTALLHCSVCESLHLSMCVLAFTRVYKQHMPQPLENRGLDRELMMCLCVCAHRGIEFVLMAGATVHNNDGVY